MQVFLLCEEIPNKFYRKFLKKVICDDDKIILNFEVKKLKLKSKINTVKKIKKNIGNNATLIISKNLKEDIEFTNLLNSNFEIVTSKRLFKVLVYDYVEYICKINKLKLQNTTFAITVNDVNDLNMNKIEALAKKFKSITIVTNKPRFFCDFKEKIWKELGIVLIITNNRKKALTKANVILNMDFPTEVLNKYCLKDDCILISLEKNIKINKKRFCGKIIDDYNIKLKNNSEIKETLEKERYKSFDLKDLADIYTKNLPEEIENIEFKTT